MKLPFIVLFFLISLSCFAQGNPTFVATADAKRVQLGDYFQVTFTAENGDVSAFKEPAFNDFLVLDQSTGNSMSIINGKVSKSSTYTYALQPKRAGRLYVRPAVAKINGKTYKTKSILVEAVKAGQKGSKDEALSRFENGKGVFVRAIVDTTNIFLGQQLIVDYTIFTSVGLSRYNTINEPEFEGSYAQTVTRYPNQVVGEVENNIPYKTKILRRVAVFPQKTGILTIPPLQVRVGVSIPGQRRNLRKVIVSEEVKIDVQSLPTVNKPSDFSGAIGDFDFAPKIGKTTVTTDETIGFRMEIIGVGDIKQIQAPTLNLSKADFEVFEPTTKEDRYEQNGLIAGKKTFEYMILPKKPGTYEFFPTFSYFDPDSLKYITHAPTSYAIDVGMGSNPIASGRINVGKQAKLKGQKAVASFYKKGQHFLGSPIFWALLFAPFLGLFSVIAYKRKQIALGNLDQALLKQQRAQKEAQKRLEQAKKLLDQKQSKAFYKEISDALWGYISDKLGIPTSELSRHNISEKLNEQKVETNHTEAFLSLLNTCDMALFAAMENEEERSNTYQETMSVITSIEENLSQ